MLDPITEWHRRYRSAAPGSGRFAVRFERPDRASLCFRTGLVGSASPELVRYVRTYVHNRLWAAGARRVVVDCGPDLFAALKSCFDPGGQYYHQAEMMSRVYRGPFEIVRGPVVDRSDEGSGVPAQGDPKRGRHIGVDLGGSDVKVVAMRDGELLHHEKMDWRPRGMMRGRQVLDVVEDMVGRALSAARLGRIDGIGLSTAGIVVGNRVVVSGIFSGLAAEEFDGWVAPMGAKLSRAFGGAPTQVAHDGDMTPLWAYVHMGIKRVLGLSLGTGLGAGFVDEHGQVSGMLCEVGKTILDMDAEAPEHIYNKTRGAALHYCSQNAVFRLAEGAGIALDHVDMLAEKLRRVQALVDSGDRSATAVFEAVGRDLAVAVAEFHDYFHMAHVVLVGRVTAGRGGEILLASADAALKRDFPEVADEVRLHVPDSPAGIDRNTFSEFAQAMAAAYVSSMCTQGPSS